MKFRYLIGALLLGLGIVSACTEEPLQTLSELKVSESYISIDVAGSTSTVTLNATQDWSVVAESVPEWLTVSPMNGAAGETKLSFTAGATTATRNAEVKILCNAKNQFINVIQYAEKVEPKMSTVAEVLAGADGDVFRVKGVCSSYDTGNANAVLYGNWYITDDTGTVYIYGTLNKAGQTKGNPLTDWGIEVGDIVTIEGPRSTYGSTIELVDVTVIAIEKSLIGVDSVELLDAEEGEGVSEFPLEGGSIKINLNVKGDDFHVTIPDAAKNWLHIEDFGSSYVTLRADANGGGDRFAEVTFSTEKDGAAYTCVQTLSQKGAILEVSIAEFLAAEVGDTQYRLTGVIVSEYAADSQGQSFTLRDWSGEVLVYRLNDYKASGAKIDDIITVVGKRGAYKETKQMVSGVYEKHIPVTTVTIAEFITKPDSKDTYYKVTGTVTSLKDNKGRDNDYGNMYVSDGTNELYLYGLYSGWGASGDNRKGFVKSAGIEVGDILTSIGYKDTYNSLIELCGGIYVSHEKGASGPSFAIDGNFDEWEDESVAKFTSVITDGERILEWRAASDADSLYLYFKINKAKVKFDSGSYKWASYLYIGFDLDNNPATGEQGGVYGTGTSDHGPVTEAGIDAVALLYPWRGETEGSPAVVNGIDGDSWLQNPYGTPVSGVRLTCFGVFDGDVCYLETSFARANLGSPASGASIVVNPAMSYYPAGRQTITLK